MKHFRYVLLFFAVLSISLIYSNRVLFGFTLICQEEDNNSTDYYLHSAFNKAWMFTSTAVGMCLGPVPLYFIYKLDTRILIAAYATIAFVSCFFYPLADSLGFWPALFSRFLSGFAQSGQLHFCNEVAQRWAPANEASFFIAVLLATAHFGPLFAMVLGGELCTWDGLRWPATYYVLSMLIVISTAIFVVLYTDEVHDNRFVEGEEKKLILAGKEIERNKKANWKAVLRDRSIWAVMVLFTGFYIGMIIYQQYSPTIIRQVLDFSIRQTGYFTALPMIFAIAIKIGVSKFIDMDPFKWGSFGSLAAPLLLLEVLSAASLSSAGLAENDKVSVLFLMLFASFHFFVPVICGRTLQIRAGSSAHFAFNASMFLAGFVQIVVPIFVALVVPNNTKEEWAGVFYSVATIVVMTTVVYVLFAKATPARWAAPIVRPSPRVSAVRHNIAYVSEAV